MGDTIHAAVDFSQHYCKRLIEIDGHRYSGYLTRSIKRGALQSGPRDLLVVRPSTTPDFLRSDKAFRSFTEALDQTRSQGVVAAAKHFITDEEIRRRITFSIAVHKFGPVPVYRTGRHFDVEYRGAVARPELAIFHNPVVARTPNDSDFRPPVIPFIDALEINPLAVFERYFEDIGFIMRDVTIGGSRTGALQRMKEIEVIVGRSITSKIDIIKPHSDGNRPGVKPEWRRWYSGKLLSNSDARRKKFFEEYSTTVYVVNYLRHAILLLVNHFYALHGINERTTAYLDRIRAEDERFRKYFLEDIGKLAGDEYPEIDDFKAFLEAYLTGLHASLHRDIESGRHPWLNDMVAFMRYLHYTRRHFGDRDQKQPMAFISRHSDDRHAEALDAQIRQVAGNHQVACHSEFDRDKERRFKDSITTRICHSDYVLTIATSLATRAVRDGGKPVDWLAAETELGVMQEKTVVLFLEESPATDIKRYKSALQRSRFPMLGLDVGRRPDRRRDFFKSWVDASAHTMFDPGSSRVDGRVADRLAHDLGAAAIKRRRLVLKGFLGLFNAQHLRLLLSIHRALEGETGLQLKEVVHAARAQRSSQPGLFGQPLQDLEDIRSDVDSMLTYFRNNQRALVLGGQTFRLLTAEKPMGSPRALVYRSGVARILAYLFPELDSQAHEAVLVDMVLPNTSLSQAV